MALFTHWYKHQVRYTQLSWPFSDTETGIKWGTHNSHGPFHTLKQASSEVHITLMALFRHWNRHQVRYTQLSWPFSDTEIGIKWVIHNSHGPFHTLKQASSEVHTTLMALFTHWNRHQVRYTQLSWPFSDTETGIKWGTHNSHGPFHPPKQASSELYTTLMALLRQWNRH